MRFDLLYPAWLSPAGVCHADGPAASQLLGSAPGKRWFPVELDGTRFHGPWPSVASLLSRWENAGGKLSCWVLNLGAGDGRCEGGDEYDPANCLILQQGWRGVLVEGDASLAAAAGAHAAGSAGARSLAAVVSPSNVTAAVVAEVLALLNISKPE
ncbi:unnamed protein product, partial [Polarella glacialis]